MQDMKKIAIDITKPGTKVQDEARALIDFADELTPQRPIDEEKLRQITVAHNENDYAKMGEAWEDLSEQVHERLPRHVILTRSPDTGQIVAAPDHEAIRWAVMNGTFEETTHEEAEKIGRTEKDVVIINEHGQIMEIGQRVTEYRKTWPTQG